MAYQNGVDERANQMNVTEKFTAHWKLFFLSEYGGYQTTNVSECMLSVLWVVNIC